MLPQVAKHRHFGIGNVVGGGDARQLDDAAFDRIHQRKVADRPGEERAFGIARTAQEERRSRKVVNGADAQLALEHLDAANPQPRRLVLGNGLLPVVAFQFTDVLVVRLFPVAMMCLVVDDDDVLEAHQFFGDAPDHLAFGFLRRNRRVATLQKRAPDLVDLQNLPKLERVVVGDDDFCLVDVVQHVAGNEFAGAIVAFDVAGQQDSQAVLDGDAGRDDEKAAREVVAGGRAYRVHGLPRDQHRHHGGLARTRCHLHGEAEKFGIRLFVSPENVLPDMGVLLLVLRHLGEPDDGLDGLHLTEERLHALKLVAAPVVEKAGRGRCDAPYGRVRAPPLSHVRADLVDDRCRVIFLLFGGKPVGVLQTELALVLAGAFRLLLARLRNGRDQFRLSPPLARWLIERLPLRIERVIPGRFLIGRIQDRLLEERADLLCHRYGCSLRQRRNPCADCRDHLAASTACTSADNRDCRSSSASCIDS